MRHVVAIASVLVLGLVSSALADKPNDKALKPYAGKLVISPDEPPRELGELPRFFKTYAMKDNHYEVFKGPPWKFHLASWAQKPIKEVTIVIAEKGAPAKDPPLLSVGYAPIANGKLLYAQVSADRSTGFEVGKTYVIKMILGKKLLATSQLLLRN